MIIRKYGYEEDKTVGKSIKCKNETDFLWVFDYHAGVDSHMRRASFLKL